MSNNTVRRRLDSISAETPREAVRARPRRTDAEIDALLAKQREDIRDAGWTKYLAEFVEYAQMQDRGLEEVLEAVRKAWL